MMDGLLWVAVLATLLVSLAALGLGLVLAARYRQLHERVMKADAFAGAPFPAPGAPLPHFAAVARDGGRARDADLSNGSALVAVFDTNCSACVELLPEISTFLEDQPADNPTLALITGTEEALAPYLSSLPASVRVVAPANAELIAAFDVRAFPTILRFEDGVLVAAGSRPADVTPSAVSLGSA
jgi:hypothetical protein